MFKNLMIYRIGLDWPTSAESLEAALAAEPFAERSVPKYMRDAVRAPSPHRRKP